MFPNYRSLYLRLVCVFNLSGGLSNEPLFPSFPNRPSGCNWYNDLERNCMREPRGEKQNLVCQRRVDGMQYIHTSLYSPLNVSSPVQFYEEELQTLSQTAFSEILSSFHPLYFFDFHEADFASSTDRKSRGRNRF